MRFFINNVVFEILNTRRSWRYYVRVVWPIGNKILWFLCYSKCEGESPVLTFLLQIAQRYRYYLPLLFPWNFSVIGYVRVYSNTEKDAAAKLTCSQLLPGLQFPHSRMRMSASLLLRISWCRNLSLRRVYCLPWEHAAVIGHILSRPCDNC